MHRYRYAGLTALPDPATTSTRSTGGFVAHLNKNSKKKHLTTAQQKRQLDVLKQDNHSCSTDKKIYGQISLCRMPRPKGKIYKD